MPNRILTSQASFTSGLNTGVEAKIDQTKLANAIDSEHFMPFALVLQENANVTLTKAVMRSDTNDERLVVLLPDAANGIGLKELNEMWKPAAGGVPAMSLKVDHGAKLVLDGISSGTETVTVLWKVLNGPPEGTAPSRVLERFVDAELLPASGGGRGLGRFNETAVGFAPVMEPIAGKTEKAGEFVGPSGKGA